ncbi:hypothetical protein FGADI_1871 [Fusarium gaditjirri]|uniref:Terpene synthase n=1 Tax=Fusarium gaditjirri TaxID=282569 RepID=A0A8H4X320_9HYPO|nr:hypothetical protein FGADI_1871 [Fusarium gaditjirri]
MVPSLITPPPSRSGEATLPKDACLNPVSGTEPEGHWVKLPEALFSSNYGSRTRCQSLVQNIESFMRRMAENPFYSALRMNDKTASIWSRLDIAYMSAICAPHADLETLKLMNDWNGWAFAFDDPFDEGTFANDPIKAAEEVIYTLATLDNVHPVVSPEENPLRHTLQSCWMRFRERSSPSLQYRWKKHLTMYCVGVLQQVGVQYRATRPTIEEYMDMRAGFAEGMDIPQYVMDHPSIQAISRITCDLVTLQNDLCSYRKDLIQGEESNIIFILKNQGMADQQAVDQIGEMLYDCYRRWHMALANLPFWGEGIDRDVIKFVNGCRNIALVYTFRYLGNDGPEVKRTRMMKLP